MLTLLWILFGLFLNIFGTKDVVSNQTLIVKVNGEIINNEIIKMNNNDFDLRQKTVSAGRLMNITCEVDNHTYDGVNQLSFTHKTLKDIIIWKCSDQCMSTSQSVKIEMNPKPETALTCESVSKHKMYKFTLVFKKFPSVTIAINNKTLAVGPKQTELTYKFHQNELIIANCTHNTLRSAIWNFNGLSIKENIKQIDQTTVKMKLSSAMNGSYIDCEDRSDCFGGACQPASIRLHFIYKDQLNKMGDNKSMLWIQNNDNKTTIQAKDDKTDYLVYKEDDVLDLTCYTKQNSPFQMSWHHNEIEINNTSHKQLSLDWRKPLGKDDDGAEFTCRVEEKLGNDEDFDVGKHYESIIKLRYNSPIATTPLPSVRETYVSDSLTLSSSNRYPLIFGAVALLLTIIIFIIVIVIIYRSKKKKSEDKLRLKPPNSIKSQSNESVQMDATYSDPIDAKQLPADNNVYDIDKTYTEPFSETREVYALPVPKRFRTLQCPKVIIDVKNKNQYYTYAKDYSCNNNAVNYNAYENSRRYENFEGNSDCPNSLYSEIPPYL